jgi:hypothetical protein
VPGPRQGSGRTESADSRRRGPGRGYPSNCRLSRTFFRHQYANQGRAARDSRPAPPGQAPGPIPRLPRFSPDIRPGTAFMFSVAAMIRSAGHGAPPRRQSPASRPSRTPAAGLPSTRPRPASPSARPGAAPGTAPPQEPATKERRRTTPVPGAEQAVTKHVSAVDQVTQADGRGAVAPRGRPVAGGRRPLRNRPSRTPAATPWHPRPTRRAGDSWATRAARNPGRSTASQTHPEPSGYPERPLAATVAKEHPARADGLACLFSQGLTNEQNEVEGIAKPC